LGGTLRKIGSPLLSFLLCSLCTPLQTDAFAGYLEDNSTKSTIKNVGLKAIREYRLIAPPLSLQNQFAVFAEYVDQQKQTVQQSLEKLELMKKALMQEYFG